MSEKFFFASLRHRVFQSPWDRCDRYPLPVLMVLDLRLPGMSGLDLLKWVRQQPQFKELPILALTAYGNRDLPRAYELGIDFYLLKPAQASSLEEILEGLNLYNR